MWTETLWQAERRARRAHWWREVLLPLTTSSWSDVLDEVTFQQFVVETREHGLNRVHRELLSDQFLLW